MIRSDSPALKPRIGLISLSAIPDDPRVRRQGDLFAERGWDVFAFGLPGALSAAPYWACLSVGDLVPPGETSEPIPTVTRGRGFGSRAVGWLYWRVVQRAASPLTRRVKRLGEVAQVYLRPEHAARTYWSLNDRFTQLYELARSQEVDVWLANDWTALPIVQKLALEQGVPYAYDTHELAVDEYAERWRWRVFQRPIIAGVEKLGIAGAAVTSCVSQGIANRLYELYRLPEKPLLIRNMPRYEAHPHRPCGETIEVLYHGVVNVGRGLEACIDSVALWRPEFRLTIRGPGPAEYLEALANRIQSAGLGARVVLAPSVPMVDLVKEAARFDVGLFALSGHSQQNVHVLPNKFFEYTMAGLALCVSDLPEMTALLRQYELGRLIPEVTPAAIVNAINGFDRASIEACKARSLVAAKELNWEAEADRFFDAIDRAVRNRAVQGLAAQ